MEQMINGGMLYHEVQESNLCAVHCINTVLQGPFFSEIDLAAVASDIDSKERQVMLDGAAVAEESSSGNFFFEDSHNVSLGGDFSIQVLQKALEVWNLQVMPLDCPDAEPAQIDPGLENAFICHLENHWFCIRKVNGEWYNFDSLIAAPRHLSRFYLSAYLDSLRGSGWSIFIVKGNFPQECPISSSNRFGQWLSPEDAERLTKTTSSVQDSSANKNRTDDKTTSSVQDSSANNNKTDDKTTSSVQGSSANNNTTDDKTTSSVQGSSANNNKTDDKTTSSVQGSSANNNKTDDKTTSSVQGSSANNNKTDDKTTSSVQGSSANNNKTDDKVDKERTDEILTREEVKALSEMEDDDLKAAIAASLLNASWIGRDTPQKGK